MQFAGFTKSYQDWTVERVAREFSKIGLNGLDLTVRKGGHVEPAEVESALPAAIEDVHQHGQEVLLVTSEITDPDPLAEKIFATAAEHGIRRIKLGYYKYVPFGTLARQMDEVRRRLEAVAALAARHQVLPCVHIHSGNDIPSHGTMLYELLKDLPPERIGAYVDPLHMTLEGGLAGWQQGLDLLAPWIKLVAIKNFSWEAAARDQHGQQRWATHVVPIKDGVAPLPEFVGTLKKIGYDGVYSLHSEYKGKHSFKDLSSEACIAQTAEDLAYLKRLI